MKKLILFAAILFVGVTIAQAQTQIVPKDHKVVTKGTENDYDWTKLKVTLNPS